MLLIQVVDSVLYKQEENRDELYETLEKLYDVELHHFKRTKDEL